VVTVALDGLRKLTLFRPLCVLAELSSSGRDSQWLSYPDEDSLSSHRLVRDT
jgi:hypothetical protein